MNRFAPTAWMILACGLAACGPSTPETPPAAEAPKERPAPPVSATGGTITGHATIELRNDRIQDLDGLELVLIPEAAAKAVTDMREERWRLLASRFNFNDGYNNLDLPAIGATAVKHGVARATADAEGRYTFTDVPPGKYRIYGQYKSMYAAGYWLLPVEVKKAGEVLKVDLGNANFAEVFNYQQK